MSVENQLAQAWRNIFDGSQQAIDWVSQVRPNVARWTHFGITPLA